MSKEELINWLIASDHRFKSSPDFNLWFEMILKDGFVGYNNMTKEVLMIEMSERIASEGDLDD
jgi:hypothetical protein